MDRLYEKMQKYMAAHPVYNSAVHVLIGLGVGILITYPFIDHPVRLGGALLALGLAGHIYPFVAKR